jgi:hypothetical protein
MPPFAAFELVKTLLPTGVAAVFGWLLLRRLEGAKSEVARYSDFSQRWAGLFFEASHTFMVSIERVMALFVFLTIAVDPNDEAGTEHARKINALMPELYENYFRITRLSSFAQSKGQAAVDAATQLRDSIFELTRTRTGNVNDLRREIDAFNQAVRIAHAEMLASRSVG